MSFEALGLRDELILAVATQGYSVATDIQLEAIPLVLAQHDLLAIAQTGTGKTAAFTLPLLQRLAVKQSVRVQGVRGLIVTPTRELAAQVANSVEIYSTQLNISSSAVFGGVRIEPQIAQLQEGVDVLIATPGRLLDLYEQRAVHFENLEIFVLDEADRMLDLGFIDDVKRIQSLLPVERQTLMFSATFSKEIKRFAREMLNAPKTIEVTAVNSTVDLVAQTFHPIEQARKSAALIQLIQQHRWSQTLVFIRTKRTADTLVTELENAGIAAASIHANRTQHARTQALNAFKAGEIKVLVATDIAARGIDVSQLPCVINYDLPYVPEDYVHRIGRTGRAGNTGTAISLFSPDETSQLQSLERFLNQNFELTTLVGFAPKVQVTKSGAATKANTRANTTEKSTSTNTVNTKSKKGKPSAAKLNVDDEELYGNFEADPHTSSSRKQHKGGAGGAKRNRRK
jgi:ATP-dependent RNA helicase RhlE